MVVGVWYGQMQFSRRWGVRVGELEKVVRRAGAATASRVRAQDGEHLAGYGVEGAAHCEQSLHGLQDTVPPDVLGHRVEVLGRCGRGEDAVLGEERGDGVEIGKHTSELQSLMRISYAVFCLKKKKKLNKT